MLSGRQIVLGVSGSIAAYKACELASLLVKAGARVQPVLTRGGARFVTPATFHAICGQPPLVDEFDSRDPLEMTHIAVANSADAILLAPASANLIARLAAGMADDMLTLVLTVTRAPVLLAPAMNTSMWTHPVVSRNIDTLVGIGYQLVEPAEGRLACGTVGPGKLADPAQIVEALQSLLSIKKDLAGLRILVTAGPTQEPIDPVRYIGNRSSGRMGYAIAEAALARSASVTLVTGPTSVPVPPGAVVVRVSTASEMLSAVEAAADEQDVVIGAAAVADFTVKAAGAKIRRAEGVKLELTPTEDIMARLGRNKGRRFLVGFAAETGDPTAAAQEKLVKKNLDMIVANDVSAPGSGFNVGTNAVTIITRGRDPVALPLMSKRDAAERILDCVMQEKSGRADRR